MDRTEVLKLGRATNKSLLDVGAGPLAVIAARDFNCRVTTIDISARALGGDFPVWSKGQQKRLYSTSVVRAPCCWGIWQSWQLTRRW